MTIFAYGVMGPPGSGKTTFCKEIVDLMRSLGRKVKLIDLDPANENEPYKSDVTIKDLIQVDEVMEEKNLGFNAALMYCMEYLEEHVDWLMNILKGYEQGTFVVLDLPGQVELFIHNNALKKIFEGFEDQEINICSVYLVDSLCCSDPGKFIAYLITTLMSMLHIELPRINVLSKVDLIPTHEKKLPFGLDFYTQVLDLDRLTAVLDDDPITGRYKQLTAALAGVIERYGLVQFTPLSIQDKQSLVVLLNLIDQAVGYSASGEDHLVASYLKLENDVNDLTFALNEKYVAPAKKKVQVGEIKIVERPE